MECRHEDRDIWKIYLERKEYAAALEKCTKQAHRDRVHTVQAEEAFTSGDFARAASFYARTAASLEEVALKFVEVSGKV